MGSNILFGQFFADRSRLYLMDEILLLSPADGI